MKKLIIGLVIGLTIGYSVTAYAAIGDTVSAVFSSFNYVVNGTDKVVDSPVLVYDGVSYVRTTDIGNMLGYDVTYKSDSRTIAFSGGTQTPSPTPVPILEPTPTPSAVTGDTYSPTPTPSVSATPTPVSQDPVGNIGATPLPSATPAPTVAPSPAPTVEPTPAPTPYVNTNEHIIFCQQYRMDPDVAQAHGC